MSESEQGNSTAERLRMLLAKCKADKKKLTKVISRQERHEHDLLKRLYVNEKTGLPNHEYLYRDCNHLFGAGAARDNRCALIFIALDDTFDVLKKTQVSIVSEWVLYKIAHWIREIVGDAGKVYHSKSAEFAVVLQDLDSDKVCTSIIERIASRMAEIHRFPGHHITVGCNIGCAMYPEHATTSGGLLRSADIALSECEKSNSPFAVFNPVMEQNMLERVNLKNGILRALEQQAMDEIRGQFELYFQPVVKVASVNGRGMKHRVIGSECLLRWNHPEIGAISPSKFIPLAEESGLIIPIGNWVLYNATRKLMEFQNSHPNPLFMSINLSPKQFHDPYLIGNIDRVIHNQGADPRAIQLEITETSVMDDPEDAKVKLDAIRDMGIRLSIDDFGTGYSSLSYLMNLDIDSLKIDKSFIDDVVTNSQNQGIVRAVISMARSLGMDILAEGVEQQDQLEFVHSEGCNQIQGYFFSKPLSSEAFSDYLSRN